MKRLCLANLIIIFFSSVIPFGLVQVKASETDSPIIRHLSIYEKHDEYCAWPAIARTADGDILVLYTRTDEHLGPDGQILMSRSTDNGETWEPPVVIFDTLIDDRESGITMLKNGDLLTHFHSTHWKASDYENLQPDSYEPQLLDKWIKHVNEPEYKNAGDLHGASSTLSKDGGKTWSEQMPGQDSIHGGIQLQDGSLFLASYRDEGGSGVLGFYSAETPQGPWKRLSTMTCPTPETIRFGEPHVLQLPSGRIIVMIRATAIPYDDQSKRAYLWESYSDDGGKTWAEPYPTPLWGFPPHLMTLSDGRILCTYGYRKPPYGERACISEDGITWKKENEIILRDDAPNSDLGYPVSIELEPGKILTVYYQPNIPQDANPQMHPPDPDRVKPGILGTVWKVPTRKDHATVTELGNRRELFVDKSLIAKLDNATLRLHHPLREGIALKFDKPWEGPFSAYFTVIKDGPLYRMYYRGLPDTEEDTEAVTCYAESRDGINWYKPDLKIHKVMGTKKTNVILVEEPFTHNFSPFLDERPGVPAEERYKAIAGSSRESGLVAFVSEDGIHWKKMQEEPVFTQGIFDSQNVAFWSSSEQRYVCYFRTWTGEGYNGFRTISRTTSEDFLHWSDPVAMSFGDTPQEHLYTNGTHAYFRAPHIYIALAKRFFPDKAALTNTTAGQFVENPKYRIASSDSIMMSSRGGSRYDRTFMEAFIRPGPSQQDWVARDNTPALGTVPGNERELFLYRMSYYAQPTAHLTRYSLRLDGFVSVNAPYEGGDLITQPFTFTGSALEINYATSAAGEIRVEIQDPAGKAIPGFSLDESQITFGDEIARTVSWEGGGDVSSLAGRAVRLRFVMRDADLYSYKFN